MRPTVQGCRTDGGRKVQIMPTHRAVTVEELSQHLHLPEKAVAKELGLCLTSLKKLCRQHGIMRWPYRKLKSLDKQILLAGQGASEDAEACRARVAELHQQKLSLVFTYGLNPARIAARGRIGPEGARRQSTATHDAQPEASALRAAEGMLVDGMADTVAHPVAASLRRAAPDAAAIETGVPSPPLATMQMPTPASAREAPQAWSDFADFASATSTSIPTPPDEGVACLGVDAELLDVATEDVLPGHSLLDPDAGRRTIVRTPSLDDDDLSEPFGTRCAQQSPAQLQRRSCCHTCPWDEPGAGQAEPTPTSFPATSAVFGVSGGGVYNNHTMHGEQASLRLPDADTLIAAALASASSALDSWAESGCNSCGGETVNTVDEHSWHEEPRDTDVLSESDFIADATLSAPT